MDALFRINDIIFTAFSKFFRFLLITLLWFVCSIPVVTLGTATAALYYTAQQIVEENDSRLVRKFFSAFRRNFRQGTILTGIWVSLLGLIYVDFAICFKLPATIISTMLAFMVLITLMVVMVMQYSFALLARYDNTIVQNLKNAFCLSFLKFGCSTAIMVLILLPFVTLLLFTSFFFATLPAWLLIAAPLTVWANSKLFRKAIQSFQMVA